MKKYTAESVTEGHPDKVCDIIADSVLDECLRFDMASRVACEVMATKGHILVAGETAGSHIPRVPEIVRDVLRRVGYPEDRYTLEVLLHRQSPDISAGVTGPLEARAGQAEGMQLGAGDLGVMEGCAKRLEKFGIPFEVRVISAHRTPAAAEQLAKNAAAEGFGVIIAAAGKAAHLGGVLAAYTTLPVIGVPMKTSDLGGMDSLLSMVQMPSGVPVACVAINGAKNAAIYATQILGACDPEYRKVIEKMKQEMADA